ncbi:MAG: class I SAM-dependent methyltransferase [Pseudomonadota bacterium]
MTDPDPDPDTDLEGAYALRTTEDAKRLYASWAATYDADFVADMDFVAPMRIAEAFHAKGGQRPVLDFGAGTGALGVELARLGVGPIDALDLSAEMLAVAQGKNVYRTLIEGNLLDGLALAQRYSGIVSSGTFTHGHAGPEALEALLGVAAPGALIVVSINQEHYQTAGFEAAFDALSDRIDALDLTEFRMYGPRAEGPHKDDMGLIASFTTPLLDDV